jgi:hypothetical protein
MIGGCSLLAARCELAADGCMHLLLAASRCQYRPASLRSCEQLLAPSRFCKDVPT